MNKPIEEELHNMSYLEICKKIHITRNTGDIEALDILAVELASKLDQFRFHYEQKEKECKEWKQRCDKLHDINAN